MNLKEHIPDSEFAVITWYLKGQHYETGEEITLKESMFKEILENYIEYFEVRFPEYKIFLIQNTEQNRKGGIIVL